MDITQFSPFFLIASTSHRVCHLFSYKIFNRDGYVIIHTHIPKSLCPSPLRHCQLLCVENHINITFIGDKIILINIQELIMITRSDVGITWSLYKHIFQEPLCISYHIGRHQSINTIIEKGISSIQHTFPVFRIQDDVQHANQLAINNYMQKKHISR